MQECKHCKVAFLGRLTDHYRVCDEYNKFINYCKNKCTKEFLEEEYLIKNKSLITISKELGLDKTRLVLSKLKEHNIPQRTLQEALANPTRQEQTRQKSREKYGVEHHLSAKNVIDKRKQTLFNMYGVESIFQTDVMKEKSKITCREKYGSEYASSSLQIRNKVKTTNIKKYGVDNPWKNKDIIDKCNFTKYKNNSIVQYYSKSSQILFWKIYNHLPKELQEKCYFAELNREFCKYIERPYMFDFVISSINYCLEYHGNYYHANPNMYESIWVNTKLNMTAQEIWDRDENKYQIIKDLGFHLDIVWEDEDIDSAANRITESILLIQQIRKDNQV